MKQKSFQISLEFCSRCLNQEINSWVNERWQDINDEAKRLILQELKAIKLRQGSCLVCKNELISEDTPKKVLRILEENNIPDKIKEEFRKFFICP